MLSCLCWRWEYKILKIDKEMESIVVVSRKTRKIKKSEKQKISKNSKTWLFKLQLFNQPNPSFCYDPLSLFIGIFYMEAN